MGITEHLVNKINSGNKKYNTDQSLVTSINSTLQADVCSRDGFCMDAIADWIFNRP